MKKLLFVVTGVGLGDSTRIHAIIDAIKHKHPDTKFLIACYGTSYNYFKNKYPVMKISGYRIPGEKMKFKFWGFIFKNYFLPLVWIFIAIKLRYKVKKFAPDLIISDFEPTGITIAKFAKKKCVTIFGFDPRTFAKFKREHKVSKLMKLQASYIQRLYNASDYVVIPSFIKHVLKAGNYFYVEPIVRKLPEQLPNENKIMEELKLSRRPILVMLGGSDFGITLAKNIVQVASKFNELFIIFGGSMKLPETENVRHIRYTNDFLKYLKIAKAVITLAGHNTLCEALVYKKPMLIYPIKQHVEQQLNAFALKGLALLGTNITPVQILQDLNSLLDNAEKLERKLIKLNFKGGGADQVVWFIEGLS